MLYLCSYNGSYTSWFIMEIKVGFFENIHNFLYVKFNTLFLDKNQIALIERNARVCIENLPEACTSLQALWLAEAKIIKALKDGPCKISEVMNKQIIDVGRRVERDLAIREIGRSEIELREKIAELFDRDIKALSTGAGKACKYTLHEEARDLLSEYPGLGALAKKIEKDMEAILSTEQFAALLFSYNTRLVEILRNGADAAVGADDLMPAKEVLLMLQSNTRFQNAVEEMCDTVQEMQDLRRHITVENALYDMRNTPRDLNAISELEVTVIQYPVVLLPSD